jgi:hypothetical protein
MKHDRRRLEKKLAVVKGYEVEIVYVAFLQCVIAMRTINSPSSGVYKGTPSLCDLPESPRCRKK